MNSIKRYFSPLTNLQALKKNSLGDRKTKHGRVIWRLDEHENIWLGARKNLSIKKIILNFCNRDSCIINFHEEQSWTKWFKAENYPWTWFLWGLDLMQQKSTGRVPRIQINMKLVLRIIQTINLRVVRKMGRIISSRYIAQVCEFGQDSCIIWVSC